MPFLGLNLVACAGMSRYEAMHAVERPATTILYSHPGLCSLTVITGLLFLLQFCQVDYCRPAKNLSMESRNS